MRANIGEAAPGEPLRKGSGPAAHLRKRPSRAEEWARIDFSGDPDANVAGSHAEATAAEQ